MPRGLQFFGKADTFSNFSFRLFPRFSRFTLFLYEGNNVPLQKRHPFGTFTLRLYTTLITRRHVLESQHTTLKTNLFIHIELFILFRNQLGNSTTILNKLLIRVINSSLNDKTGTLLRNIRINLSTTSRLSVLVRGKLILLITLNRTMSRYARLALYPNGLNLFQSSLYLHSTTLYRVRNNVTTLFHVFRARFLSLVRVRGSASLANVNPIYTIE